MQFTSNSLNFIFFHFTLFEQITPQRLDFTADVLSNGGPYQLCVKGAAFHFCSVQLECGGIRYLSYECIRTTSEEFFDAVICAVEKFTFFFLLVLFGFAQCSQRQLPHLLV